MSLTNEDVLSVLEKRVGINGRAIDLEISKAKSQIKKQNTISYADSQVQCEFNPEGESFIVLKQTKSHFEDELLKMNGLKDQNQKLKAQVMQLQQQMSQIQQRRGQEQVQYVYIQKTVQVPVQKIVQRIVQKYIQVPVERIVEIPVERIVERLVEVPVEKIIQIQKRIEVPVERIVQVIKEVDKIIEIPIEKIKEIFIQRIVQVPVEKIVQIPVEKRVEVVVEKLIEVPVEKIIERIVEIPVERIIEVQKIVEVEKRVQVPVEIIVNKIIEVERIVEVPVEKIITVQKIIEVEKIIQVEKEVQKIIQEVLEIEEEVKKIEAEPEVKVVEIQKIIEVPVEKIVYIQKTIQVPVWQTKTEYVEKIVQVPIEKVRQVPVEVIKEIIVEKIIEVPVQKIRQIPVQVLKEILVERIIQVPIQKIKQVEKQIIVERIVEVPVQKIRQVPVEIIKEVLVEKIIEVPIQKIKEVIKEIFVDRIVEVPIQKIIQSEPLTITVEKIVQIPIYIDREVLKQVRVPVEMVKTIEIQKSVQVPVEKIIEKEKIVQVPIQVEKIIEVIREVPVDRIIEKEVQVIVEKIVEVEKLVEVPIEVFITVEKILEVPFEKIVEVQVIKEVIVRQLIEIPVENTVPVHVIEQKIVQVPVERVIERVIERFVQLEIPVQLKMQQSNLKSENKQVPVEKETRKPVQVTKQPENIPSSTSLENLTYRKQTPRLEDLEMVRGQGGLLSDRSVESYRNKSKMFLNSEPQNFVDKLNAHSEQKLEDLQQEEKRFQEEEEIDQLRGINQYLQEQIRIYEEELEMIRGDNQRRDNEREIQTSRLQAEIQKLKQTIKQMSNQLGQFKGLIQAEKNQNKKLKQQKRNLEENLRKQKQERKEMLQEVERNQNRKQENAINELNEILQTYKYQKESLQINFINLKQDLEQAKRLNERLQTRIDHINQEKQYLERFIEEKEGNEANLIQQINSLKSIGVMYKENQKDRSAKEIAYLKEQNQTLHAMIEQLQEEKQSISCKFIEEQQKIQGIINSKDREIIQLKSKQKQTHEPLRTKKNGTSSKLILNSEEDIDLSINSVDKEDQSKRFEEVRRVLSNSVPSGQLGLIFSYISDLKADLQSKEKSIAELQVVVTRFEKHIKSLESDSHGLRQSQYIQRIEGNLQVAHSLIEKMEREKYVLAQENDRLQMSISELREGLEGNFDGETQMLIEQLTSQLQNEKNINEKLQKRLERQSKEIMQYERQFFEKTEKINYLNLLLIKKQKQQAQQVGVSSDKVIRNQDHQEIKEANIELQAKLRKYEIELLRYQKQNKNLQNDIRSMKKSQEKLQSHILNSPFSSPRSLSPRISLKMPQPATEVPERQEVYTLENLVENYDGGDEKWRVIVVKVIEKYLELYQLETYYCFEPSNIILIGDPSHPQSMIVQLNASTVNHLFTAPEMLQNKKCNQLSMVWNLGTIIDFILSGKPFFKSLEDVKKFSGYYRSRQGEKGYKGDKFESKTKEIHDVLVNMINPFPTLRSSMSNSSHRLIDTLYLSSGK